ncbi:MAG: RnfABCDGE type electron transport complex subunit G [Candidatus Methanospirareceae archaeon]
MVEELRRIVGIAIPLIIICIISGAALTASYDLTKGRIEMVEQERINESLSIIFPGASFTETDGYYIAEVGGEEIGYAFIAEGKGYSGSIKTMVGMYKNGTIRRIHVITQSETPGLGTRIAEPDFTDQFSGKRVEEIRLRRDGGVIDAITGATISSRAITDIVRERAEVVMNETR